MADKDPNNENNNGEPTDARGVDLSSIGAEAIIEAFGGIRPMATKLDIAVSTVQGWKNRNHIPETRFEDILLAAQKHDVDLTQKRDASSPDQASEVEEVPNGSESDESVGDTPWNSPEDASDTPGEASEPVDAEIVEEAASSTETPDTTDTASSEKDESAKEESSKSEDAPRSSSGLSVLAIILSLSTGAALLSQPYWQGGLDHWLEPKIEQLAPAIANIRKSQEANSNLALLDLIKPLEDRVSGEMAGLNARLSELEGRPTDVARLQDIQDLEADLADLAARLDQLISLSEAIDTAEAESTEANQVSQSDTAADASGDAVAAIAEQSGRTLAALVQFEARLTEMEETLDSRMAQVPADVEASTVKNLELVNSRLDAISARVSLTENRMDTEDIGSPMDNQAAREAAILLAVGQLETVALSGERYTEALDSLESLTVDLPEFENPISLLKQNTETGLVTRTEIARYFAALASNATQLADAKPADTWQEKTLTNLQSLFSLRRIGEGPDASPVSVAESALIRDDLRSAIDAMVPLAARSDAIANWIDFTESRLQSEKALRALRGLSLELMSASVRRQMANNELEKVNNGAGTSDETSNGEATQ